MVHFVMVCIKAPLYSYLINLMKFYAKFNTHNACVKINREIIKIQEKLVSDFRTSWKDISLSAICKAQMISLAE